MNKSVQTLVISYLLLGICNAAWSEESQTADDHLIPMNGRIDAAYKKLLNRRLFVTPASYTRILVLASPAAVGEVAIAIYSTNNDADDVRITVTRAERNLWAAEFGGDPNFPKIPAVKVSRCDAALPKVTASVVSAAIRRMIEDNRPLSKKGRIIIDATDIVFSVEDRHGMRLEAVLTPDSKGKKCDRLRRLTQLLERFCQAKAGAQPGWLKKVHSEAQRLVR